MRKAKNTKALIFYTRESFDLHELSREPELSVCMIHNTMEQHGGITKTKNQNGLEHAFFSPLCVDLYSNLFSNFQSTKSYFILMPQTRGGDRMREHKNSIPLYPSSQKKQQASKQGSMWGERKLLIWCYLISYTMRCY